MSHGIVIGNIVLISNKICSNIYQCHLKRHKGSMFYAKSHPPSSTVMNYSYKQGNLFFIQCLNLSIMIY